MKLRMYNIRYNYIQYYLKIIEGNKVIYNKK